MPLSAASATTSSLDFRGKTEWRTGVIVRLEQNGVGGCGFIDRFDAKTGGIAAQILTGQSGVQPVGRFWQLVTTSLDPVQTDADIPALLQDIAHGCPRYIQTAGQAGAGMKLAVGQDAQ